jgi:hypothetical protein
MDLPYTKYIRASLDQDIVNNILSKKADLLVENYKMPEKIIAGKKYFPNWEHITGYWIGSYGCLCEIEFVDEDILEVY